VTLGLVLATAQQLQAKTDNAAASVERGRKLFASLPCGTCHTLADAGSTGGIGPVLDGDPNLSEALIVSRITNGQGAMPAFGDQLSEQDMTDIAAYLMHVGAK
jgi:mono/diheme cytochrome c family protein